MKLPVDGIVSPLNVDLARFASKDSYEIIRNTDEIFKQQLKTDTLRIISKANRSFQDKVDAWQYVRPFKAYFANLFQAAIRLALSEQPEFGLTMTDRYQLLTFFNHAFNSIEVDFVNEQVRKYLPLSIWVNLSASRREAELAKLSSKIRAAWKKLLEKDEKLDTDALMFRMFERKFLFKYIKQFISMLPDALIPENHHEETKYELNREVVLYCQRFLEFLIDIESQLPLRRFFHAIIDYTHLVVRCQQSGLARHKSPEGNLFGQLVELLLLFTRYEIDLMTGDPFSDLDILRKHEEDITALQKLLWSKHPHLRKFAIKPIRAIDNPQTLYKIITSFGSKEELFEFLRSLGIADDESLDHLDRDNAPLMAAILMNHYRRYEPQTKKINSIPLFPNESVIWDTNLVPDQYYNYEYPLAIPKLNLQFLTISDYLLRNFVLFKNESTYEIRQDLEDGITRSKCRWTDDGCFATGPKQRMALILKDYSIVDVGKPKLGESCPSRVLAKVVINMDYVRPEWRKEWEQLRKHDTCFLVSFEKISENSVSNWPVGTFPEKNNIKHVRGCEIEGLLDKEGKIVDENSGNAEFTDNLRVFLVRMDCNQYRMDQIGAKEKKLAVYDKFHLIVRRKPEQNNFKGVLETIRDLINTKFVVPDWLRNLLIGFGDPADAHYSNLRDPGDELVLDYYDTFLDYQHLVDTMSVVKPEFKLISSQEDDDENRFSPEAPFRIKLDFARKELTVIPYQIPSRGPYPTVIPKKNTIRFTSAQVEAITSGLQSGLTMVVGPPGTGKTDVAVQILSSLYHSNPEQRTLIVTHSNQALNQIFEKMIELDVKEHHLLRLGHGEEDLQSTRDFSRQGRVKHVLARRLELLVLVDKLAQSLGLDPGRGFTCESAEYFHFYHIISRWDEYIESIRGTQSVADVSDKFPFLNFFQDAPQPLFRGASIAEDFETAKGCYRYIKQIFNDLRSFRPFEIFSSGSDRSKYLLIREAKIIAMTCTHAGLRRKELVEMNFQYDNILMEETAQILEIETTIPLLLQNPENGVNRLKRWIMIGDHHQLPPIILNSAFQKFSNMEQSLFARFIRLGVPAIELDAQGRSRPSLCDLFRWRYKNLGELEHVRSSEEFKRANAGFAYEYQLVDVSSGGETAPLPYFYQNRDEAEFVVSLYKYMISIGYPAQKITILTTYNGQKQLLKELFESQCTSAYICKPSRITTVDKFQGQQNDYILLSLVRTKTVGHLRDIRRLVVAMSRARLGLYVFARVGLFSNCFELQNAMKLFLSRPQNLCLLTNNETYPTERQQSQTVDLSSPQVRLLKSVEDMQQLASQVYTNYLEQRAQIARSLDDEDTKMDETGGDKD